MGGKIIKAAFIGLGVMGGPMAGHLAQRGGLEVAVYNRTWEKAKAWVAEHGGRMAETPAEAARGADMVCMCVGNDDDVREVMTGADGILAGVREGAIIVDHTTASAKLAREMGQKAAAQGVRFLDAPVSGGQSGAQNGQLTIMVGGDEAAYAAVEPILRKSYAKEIRLIGRSGAGQLAKMVNQICIAGTLQGLSEALAFGVKAGLDMEQVLGAISKGGAQSWQMDNRGRTMIEDKFDFGFAIKWMAKDLKIVVEEAKEIGANVNVTEQILGFYQELISEGLGRMDTSALIKRLI